MDLEGFEPCTVVDSTQLTDSTKRQKRSKRQFEVHGGYTDHCAGYTGSSKILERKSSHHPPRTVMKGARRRGGMTLNQHCLWEGDLSPRIRGSNVSKRGFSSGRPIRPSSTRWQEVPKREHDPAGRATAPHGNPGSASSSGYPMIHQYGLYPFRRARTLIAQERGRACNASRSVRYRSCASWFYRAPGVMGLRGCDFA